jgi:hypothetical protein
MEVSGVHGRPARPGRQAISPATVAPPSPSLTSGRRPHASAHRPSAGRPARRVQRLPPPESRPAREEPNPLLDGQPERWEAARRFGDRPDRLGVSVAARGRRDRPEGWGTARPGGVRPGRVPIAARRRSRGARRNRSGKDGSPRGPADPARMPTDPPLGDRSRPGRAVNRQPSPAVRDQTPDRAWAPGPRANLPEPPRAPVPGPVLPRNRVPVAVRGPGRRRVRVPLRALAAARSSWTRRPARPGITGKG